MVDRLDATGDLMSLLSPAGRDLRDTRRRHIATERAPGQRSSDKDPQSKSLSPWGRQDHTKIDSGNAKPVTLTTLGRLRDGEPLWCALGQLVPRPARFILGSFHSGGLAICFKAGMKICLA